MGVSCLQNGREEFMAKLRVALGEALKHFLALDNIERAFFVLGCELWMEYFNSMLALVTECIIYLWEVKLHENHALPSLSLSPRLGIPGMALWLGGREEVRLVSSVTPGDR